MKLQIYDNLIERKTYSKLKIRNINEDLISRMQSSWYMTAVCKIMTDFLITIRWTNLINSPIFEQGKRW